MKTVGVEVFPCVEDDGAVRCQYEGSDDTTSFWTVYHRLEDGTCQASGDFNNFATAHSVAWADAFALGVPLTREVE